MRAAEQELQGELEKALEIKEVQGVALISRDGLPLLSAFDPDFNAANLSLLIQGAMIATLMGAAEVALGEVGGGNTRRVIAEADGMTLIVMAVTEEHLLVSIAQAGAALDTLAPHLEDTQERLRTTLVGA